MSKNSSRLQVLKNFGVMKYPAAKMSWTAQNLQRALSFETIGGTLIDDFTAIPVCVG